MTIWLNLTTKQHIADRNRLKPSKITVPYSLNTSESLDICLITADPQRAVKDVVADANFPTTLAQKITKIIGFTKLRDRYKTFEQRRQLLSEHDLFLADDRIASRLPQTLGKIFYKSTAKRPIPIRIYEQNWVDGKREKSDSRPKRDKREGSGNVASAAVVANAINKAIDDVHVNVRPGISVSVRVGLASFSPEKLAENIAVVVKALIEKHVAKGWRNVKVIHIKSQSSLAVPIWLADELWVDVENIQDPADTQIEAESKPSSKRKRNFKSKTGPQVGQNKRSKLEEDKVKERQDEKEMSALRKTKLAAQKAKIMTS